jgi:stearoyl-CoA desaturase (delta-9 desaturase)
MVFLSRKELRRTGVFVRAMATGILGGELGWSWSRRLASAYYCVEVFGPMLFLALLPTAGWNPSLLASGLLLGTCGLAWFGVMIYLHRYLAHRSFRIRFRPLEWALSLIALLAMQGYPLTWAFMHRRHHQTADTEADPHSPAHTSWMWLFSLFKLDYPLYPDDKTYPAYQAAFKERLAGVSREQYASRTDRYALLSALAQAAWFTGLYAIGGWDWVVYLQLLPIVVVHVEVDFFINVLSHRFGYRNFELQGDRATNHWTAGLSIAEWQNNHHRYPAAASTQVRWWELDPLYAILVVWKQLGLVSDLVGRSDDPAA